MPIEFRCNQCGKLLRTGDDTAGKQAKCPECGAVMPIPVPGEQAPPAAQPVLGSPAETAGVYGDQGGSENPYQSPAAYAAPGPVLPAAEIRPTPILFGDMFARTWAVFMDRWLAALGGLLLVLAINGFGQFLMSGVAAGLGAAVGDRSVAQILAAIAQIGGWVLSVWLNIGLMMFVLGLVRGEESRFGLIVAGGRYLAPIVLCVILMTVIIGFGLLLLIVPGVIFALMLSQAQLLIIDRDLPVLEALSLSRRVMVGNKLTVLAVWLLAGFAGIALVVITCGLGVAIVGPFLILLNVVIYLGVTGQPTSLDRYAAAAMPSEKADYSPLPQARPGDSPFMP